MRLEGHGGTIGEVRGRGGSNQVNQSYVIILTKSRTKTYGDRAFSIAGPRLWNELPLSFRSVSDINVFKRSLKTHLFQHAYSGYV